VKHRLDSAHSIGNGLLIADVAFDHLDGRLIAVRAPARRVAHDHPDLCAVLRQASGQHPPRETGRTGDESLHPSSALAADSLAT
jgi:hypothetical protein